MAMTALAVVAFPVGLLIVASTVLSAIMTLVVPRAIQLRITRWVFVGMRVLFAIRSKRARNFKERDRRMALYGPISLFTLAATWVILTGIGYVLMFWSLGVRPLREAIRLSGSSIFTLGFAAAPNLPTTLLAFSEAGIGLTLLAMLISYLPSMYASFSRREVAVAALDGRAGTPPTPTAMFIRTSRIDGWDRLGVFWRRWEGWFVEITETQTSLPALVFFRSSHWEQSWVTASGAVLDAASLFASTVDRPRSPDAEWCIRAGYIALRRIADFFGIPHNPEPTWPEPGYPSRPTWTRHGATSPAGASTTTGCCCRWRRSPWRPTRPGRPTGRSCTADCRSTAGGPGRGAEPGRRAPGGRFTSQGSSCGGIMREMPVPPGREATTP